MTSEVQTKTASVFTWSLSAVLLAMALLVALLTSQAALALLCVLLLSTTAGARLWSRFSLARLKTSLTVDKHRLFPGEALSVQIEVQNAKLLPVWLQLGVPLSDAFERTQGPAREGGLSGYQRLRFEWQVGAQRRGVHELGPIELVAGDPLGFFARKMFGASAQVVIFPRLVPLRPLALPARELYGRPGAQSVIEDRTYIQGARDYQNGRPARYIHWKASARHNHIVEKMFEPTQRQRILLSIQAEGFALDPTGQTLERCLEVVASLAVELDRRGYSVGLATDARLRGGGSPVIKVSSNPAQLSELLETLARIEPVGELDVLEVVRSQAALSGTVSIVHFAYAIGAASDQVRGFYAHRKLPVVYVTCSGDAPEDAGSLRLSDLRLEAEC